MKASGISLFGISILTVLCTTASLSLAQEPPTQEQTAPPPLKIVVRQDRIQIDGEKDSKSRVRLTLELAEGHLANAESQTLHLNYDEAAAEIGKYSALIEDVFAFLGTLKQDSNKARDLYKRVEMTLRSQGLRLGYMRRVTPVAHAVWIKETEEFARRGRTEALNSFYGQTVIRERPSAASPRPGNSAVQSSAVPTEKKP